MKKSIKVAVRVVVILLVLLMAVYGVWVQFPRVEKPEKLEATLKSATERMAAVQSQAEDPEKNGYLSPTFLPYWGRKGMEQDENAPVKAVMESWKLYSSQASGELIDHKKLLAEKDEKYLRARADFLKVAPELQAAMEKPVFAAPETTFNHETLVLNYIMVRQSAHLMVGLGESLASEGRVGEAADVQVSVIEFASHLMNGSMLIQEMIAVAIQSIGLEGFIGTVGPSSPLPTGQWKELSERLVGAVPPEGQLVRVLESEMLFATNSLQSLRDGRGKGFSNPIPLPGFLEREERIYNNVMMHLLEGVESGQPLQESDELMEPSASDWVAGRSGPIVALLVPNFSRASSHLDYNRDLLLGLATSAGVLAYREQQGSFPKSLSDLETAKIATVEADSLKRMEYSLNGGKAQVRLAMLHPTEIDFSKPGPWGRTWYEYKNGTLHFNLGSVQD